MKLTLFLFLLFFLTLPAFSQPANCNVIPLPIQGKYSGECRDGKANGKGKSVGMDSFEGNFKKGYPDGEGTYTWQNGNYFIGNFRKNVKAGKGEMHFLKPNKPDSIVTGFWKKDNYVGMYENPYEILELSPAVTYKNFQKYGTKKSSVIISMESGMLGTANVTNFLIMQGSYIRYNKAELTKSQTIDFQNVEFPFRVKFIIDKGPLDILINESGEWHVEIVL